MAPSLGQHTDEVLRELGKNDGERKALFEKGVVV
jgi:crotonobetainyl-CoA:carnitine CoA-transferase CaiB-like acyl-CoA transferase